MDGRDVVCLNCGGPVQDAIRILRSAGWRTSRAETPDEAGRLIIERKARVALAVLGSRLTPAFESQKLEPLLQATPQVGWVAVVEPEMLERNGLLRLIASYFWDYLTSPFQSEYLVHSVGHAYGMAAMAAAVPEEHSNMRVAGRDMFGRSAIMQRVLRDLGKCARADAAVTITGESGTGKELAAREIHQRSAQHGGPFIAVNCGAIPDTLIQAELFGHTKGAFTGADRDREGRIEAARDGTLFLDEIGDLPLLLQANLLRFLQEGVIEKIGATQPIRINTRVIAATNKNLEQAVKDGEFREDLYYRLNVLRIELPPLRDRGEDIESLAHAYLTHFSRLNNSRAIGFTSQGLSAIKGYSWPGNIRELVNRIQRAVVMSERRLITPVDLDLDRRTGSRIAKTLEQARAQAEKDALCGSLSHSGNNIAETARRLGVSRLTVYRLIEKHGLGEGTAQIH